MHGGDPLSLHVQRYHLVAGRYGLENLLALAFTLVHLALEQYEPGSYLRDGLALSAPENLTHGKLSTSLIYFSFTTLTTLGFGDISPARPVAEMLTSAEAVIGQLYVAIFIGGLVAMRISPFSALLTALVSDERRGSLMSLTVALGQLGFALGGAIAGPLYAGYGYRSNTVLGAVSVLIMGLIVWFFIPEPEARRA